MGLIFLLILHVSSFGLSFLKWSIKGFPLYNLLKGEIETIMKAV